MELVQVTAGDKYTKRGSRPAMKVPLAWRILTDDKRRTALALIGIFMAILLVFVELGFFYAVPRGGLLLYDNMRFDLLLASNQYEYQAQPGAFPLSQLEKVRSSPDVAEATPIYFGVAKWKSGEGDLWPDVFMIGYDPASHIFIPDSINRQTAVLDRVDTVLVDSSTRPIFGPLDTGRVVEIDDRKVTIGGQYALGTGFMGLGVALASTANFARLFPQRGSTIVNLGTIRLKAGVDPDRAASDLQKLTGAGHEDLYASRARRTRNRLLDDPHLGRNHLRIGAADLIRGRNHDRVPDRVHPGRPAIAAIRDLESDRLSRPRASHDG